LISASRKGAGAPTPALLTGTVTFTHFVIRVQLFRDQLSWLGLPRRPWLNGRFHWKRGSPLSRVDLHPWRRGSDHAHAFPDDRQRSRRSLSKLRPVGEKSDPDSRLIWFWSKTPGTWARCCTLQAKSRGGISFSETRRRGSRANRAKGISIHVLLSRARKDSRGLIKQCSVFFVSGI
jgi:hypothetical protein